MGILRTPILFVGYNFLGLIEIKRAIESNKDASFLSKLYFIYFPLIPVFIEFGLSLKDFSYNAIKYFIIRFI